MTSRPRRLRGAFAALAFCTCWLGALGACATSERVDYYVAPRGSDGHDGTDQNKALKTVRAALEKAQPGDVIYLLPGEYKQDIDTLRGGEQGAPIRLIGVTAGDGRKPVIRGAGSSHIIDIAHSHVWLEDLVVDGLVGKPGDAEGYRSKLIYVMGALSSDEETRLSGVRLLRLTLRNAGTECVRFKFGVIESEIAESLIENCGVWDFRFRRGKKNGEGIYIGTAPEQMPSDAEVAVDDSRGNWIHHNWIRTNGAECVDVKEGATANRIEFNECSGLRDPDSGGISIRGARNFVTGNRVHDNLGAGIRLGGDQEGDCVGNEVRDNELYRNAVAAFKVLSQPQGRLCGNRVREGEKLIRGPRTDDLDPRVEC